MAQLQELSKITSSMKRNLKRDYYSAKFEECIDDSKKTWELLREVTGNNKIQDNIEPANITKVKANMFNKYFATIGAETLKTMGTTVTEYTPSCTKGFKLREIKAEDVEDVINGMKINTAVGYDQIPARIIKDLAQVLSPSLSELINLSFSQSKFPQDLKYAIVRPIFKNKGTE